MQRDDAKTRTPITLTIPGTVEVSGLSRSTIYEALKKGDLTAVKAGRRTLIRHAELEEYLARLPAYRAEHEASGPRHGRRDDGGARGTIETPRAPDLPDLV